MDVCVCGCVCGYKREAVRSLGTIERVQGKFTKSSPVVVRVVQSRVTKLCVCMPGTPRGKRWWL